MATEKAISSFRDFWPFYLSQHSKRGTRFVHFVGTTAALSFIPVFISTHNWHWLVVGLFTVYGLLFSPIFLSRKIVRRPSSILFILSVAISKCGSTCSLAKSKSKDGTG